MRLLIKLAGILAVIAVSLLVIGLLLPKQGRVERSIVINAPPPVVFGLVNGFGRFEEWSPWADKDPAMKVERSGPETGVGATYAWSGNAAVGSGSQKIIESVPPSHVRTRLHFGGFAEPSLASLDIAPDGSGSRVTWSLTVEVGSNPVNRYFGLLMNKMVGPDYEKGLARLKQLAEAQPLEPPAAPGPEPAADPAAAPAAAPSAEPAAAPVAAPAKT